MVAELGKEWRVRADKIEYMFSGKKDKPPTFRIQMRLIYIAVFVVLILALGVLFPYNAFAKDPEVEDKKNNEGTNNRSAKQAGLDKHHMLPATKLAALLGHTDADAMIKTLNQEFTQLPAKDQPMAVLKWASEHVPDNKWCQVTSFGPTGLVALDIVVRHKLQHDVCVATIDTLHLFPETYELMTSVKQHFSLPKLHVFRPEDAKTRNEFEAKYGAYLWRADPHLFDYVTKVNPMRRALDELDVYAWITGRRKSQGGDRLYLPLIEIDKADGRVKLNPFSNWSKEDVWSYIRENKLPYNKLHDQGYQSVGDVVTTEKTPPESGERAGRFKGQNRTECGMHVMTTTDTVQQLQHRSEIIKTGYEWDFEESKLTRQLGVTQVTEDSFQSEVIDSGGHVLLEVYAPWCSHCMKFGPIFRQVAEQLLGVGNDGATRQEGDAKVPDLKVARMDGYQNKVATAHPGFVVNSFPTLFLALKNSKEQPMVYSGARQDASDVVRWVRSAVSSVSSSPGTA